MLYFFHHYELPVILQQVRLQQLFYRNHAQTQTARTVPTAPDPSVPSSSPAPPAPSGEQTQQNYITELSQLDPDPNNPQQQNSPTELTSAQPSQSTGLYFKSANQTTHSSFFLFIKFLNERYFHFFLFFISWILAMFLIGK